MTLPAYIGAGAGSETSSPWPAGHAAGHFGLMLVAVVNEAIPTPAGWNRVPLSGVAANGARLFAWWRFATSGAEGNVDPRQGVGPNFAWGRIFTFSGVNTRSPIHRVSAMGTPGGSTGGVTAALVTERPHCMIAQALAWNADNAGGIASAEANSSLASLAERGDDGTVTNSGGGVILYTGEKSAQGEVDQTTMTLVNTTVASLTIALAPADQYTIAGNWMINGGTDPAPDGSLIEFWDKTLGVLERTSTVGGGSGAYSTTVPYNDHDYRVVGDDSVGPNYSASELDQAV